MYEPYRYKLTRTVGYQGRLLCWIMLNPSTADEVVDDPTIRRVKSFTLDNGYARLVVVNLFALRATRPSALLLSTEPIGAHNPMHIAEAVSSADAVVFAWGAWLEGHKLLPRLRPENIVSDPLCLGVTNGGSPKHPLYIPASQPLVPFPTKEIQDAPSTEAHCV